MKIEKSLLAQFAFAAILVVAVAATGCSKDGSGAAGTGGVGGEGGRGGEGGSSGGGGMEPCTGLCAEPPGASFPTRITVELTTDTAGATIYYTTDLSPVLDEDGNIQGAEYTGPITIAATTVLKFLEGVDSGAGGGSGQTFSPELTEGYTRTNGDSKWEEWAKSGHGDLTSDAWRHWDPEEEGGEVPSYCAKCHGAMQEGDPQPDVGFLEFVETGDNTNPVALPLGLQCINCHRFWGPTIYGDLDTYASLEPVEFPSGDDLSLWSPSNICMTCHQGAESGVQIQALIDASDGPYEFLNIHYYPAAAVMFGSESNAGYEYEGMDYRPRNTFPSHPGNYANCVGCHMRNAVNGESHTWVPTVDKCSGCHDEGDSFETLKGSPSQSYTNIWGADGGASGLMDDLFARILDYAENEIGKPILYSGHDYPYWFNDNGMGTGYANRYTDFDAPLLAAAYNYVASDKEPAGYIHNGTYIQQLLHDSIMDLGGSTAVEVIDRGDLAFNSTGVGNAEKTQQWQISGHGAADEVPFRYWDGNDFSGFEDGEVPLFCTKCHTTGGFVQFAAGDRTSSHLATTAVDCWSCHSGFNLFRSTATRWDAAEEGDPLEPVEFPSGAELTFNNNSNLCMSCHQGRASGLDVRTAEPNDEVQNPDYDSFDAINIHYYAAAAVLFGRDADAGYQYRTDPDDPDTELSYAGKNLFVGFHESGDLKLTDCIGCHMNSNPTGAPAKHTFMPQEVGDCSACHSGGPEFKDLQTRPQSYWFAIDTLKSQLLQAIEDYADGGGLPITSPAFYDGHHHPYWFHQGGPPEDENAYRDFDRNMLAAAYNYMVADKDPGGYIHNGIYIQQLLWDSIIAMGACPNLNPPPPGRDPNPPTCP